MNRIILILSTLFLFACGDQPAEKPTGEQPNRERSQSTDDGFDMSRTEIYTPFELTTELSKLSEEDKQIIPILIEAASIMDDLFWIQSYGDKDALMTQIGDPKLREFARINYGPWDRLADDKPFVDGFGEKPAGANFYPQDMTKEEFDAWSSSSKSNLYTMVRRNAQNQLEATWYHEFFSEELGRAAELLREAAAITNNGSFKYYLELRAEAFETGRYNPSDVAWLSLEDNNLDIIIGPIENYEDKLFGYKAAFEAYVLVKDQEWSKQLERFKDLLPRLQEELPCDPKYKQDKIGGNAQLNAYDVIYYAGDCNSGSKTIAVNLPNDEEIQQNYGTRRSQLKNAMRAKYDKILVHISDILITEDQRKYITFDAFFANTMFHEVAHGLGIKNTIDGQGTVREALKEQSSALEEGKADILGLWMVTKLFEWEEYDQGQLMDNYVTFMAGIFRSVRFGASSAHGKANMLRFNYFREKGAFTRRTDGTYAVDFAKMQQAMTDLSALILQLQGDGAYEDVKSLMEEKGTIKKQLQDDLNRLDEAKIPVDIVFEQGVEVLGL